GVVGVRNWLQAVELRCQDVVLRAGQSVEAIWFPETCVVGLVVATPEGRDVECGMIGHEGVVGLGGAIAGGYSYTRQTVQIGGAALGGHQIPPLPGGGPGPRLCSTPREDARAAPLHCFAYG